MPSFAAFLGHQPHISIAEIAAVLPDFSLEKATKDVAIFQTGYELNAHFIDLLGGTMVIARQITDAGVELKDIPQLLSNEVQGGKRSKVTFSLRAAGLPPRQVHDLYRACKQYLKKKGQPSRYVGNEHKPAMPIVLHENDMIEGKRGCEIAIIADQETGDLWIGRTVAAQDVDAYTKRDMEKPVRDTGVGLLPPKLAQILLNFGLWAAQRESKPPKTKKFSLPVIAVFDPFCGTGVIPMECVLRGWPVLASDLMQKAVNGCEKNLEWLRKEEKIAKKDVLSEVWKQDAKKPFTLKKLPDAVVTETTLGPSLLSRPPLKEVQKMRTENDRLQVEFLRNAAATLPGVPLVCTLPVWYTSKGPEQLKAVWQEAEKLGYKPVLPVSAIPETTGRNSLLYRRPNQMVGREIVIWMPQSK
ncbi:MAG: hypothetical protein PHO92_00885 [Candidatus Peribacteraceae bacterium]|nr:hypothetical protein [Candidatus Peribacteraceae bacterium]